MADLRFNPIIALQCIQCELRHQECVFSASTKKRGRRGRTTEETSTKRKKVAAPVQNGSMTPIGGGPIDTAGPKLLSNENLQTLRAIQSGNTQHLQTEQLIDLIMAQQAKLDFKKKQLAESDTNGFFGKLQPLLKLL